MKNKNSIKDKKDIKVYEKQENIKDKTDIKKDLRVYEKRENTVNIESTITQSPKDSDEYTGAPLDLPEDVKKVANQRTNLIERVPYKQEEFSIDYDYENAKYVVILSNPKDKNKELFLNWLKDNYPDIPLDEFIFK